MLLPMLLAAAPAAAAPAAPPLCTSKAEAGAVCVADVMALHPTRFAFSEREARALGEKLADLSADELKAYIIKHPIPVVVGPKARLYIIDDHLLSRVLWELGGSRLYAEVEA